VWSALFDPVILAAVMPGCEKLDLVDGQYVGEIKVKVGPIQGKFTGKVDLKDKVEPESYTMIVDGRGAPGFVKATAAVKLAPEGERTRVFYDTDAQVGGKIASVGQRLLDASARAIVAQSLEGLHANIKLRAAAHREAAAKRSAAVAASPAAGDAAKPETSQPSEAAPAAAATAPEATKPLEAAGTAPDAAGGHTQAASNGVGATSNGHGATSNGEAAGKSTEAAGKVVEAAGKATEAVGKATEAVNQATEATSKATEAVGKAIEAASKAAGVASKGTEATGKPAGAAGTPGDAGKAFDVVAFTPVKLKQSALANAVAKEVASSLFPRSVLVGIILIQAVVIVWLLLRH
jgi:carbon monoxide dehydrogenase subunit G/uncharacterized protein YjbJ (UPF0337 family)